MRRRVVTALLVFFFILGSGLCYVLGSELHVYDGGAMTDGTMTCGSAWECGVVPCSLGLWNWP